MAYLQRRGNQDRNKRRDVKERTMNRFAVFDEDIASRYDYDDEEETKLPINQRVSIRNTRGGGTALVRNRQIQRQAPGIGRREQIFQVVVRNNGKGGIQFVAQALTEHVTGFMPFNFSVDSQNNVTFFVLTEEEAENIKFFSRRISYPPTSREKFIIYYKRTNAPWETLATNMKKAVADVLATRLNSQINSLDLSGFQHDKIFVDRDLANLSALTRNAVMVEVIKVIADKYNQITGLSLKIRKVDELDKLRKWTVERLHLENNPLCGEFTDASSYTSAVHDYFPRVSYLDGSIVHCNPYKINADNQRRAGQPYPPVQPGFAPDEQLRCQVEALLIQFFDLYDDPQPAKARQNLIHAYDEDATFTHVIQFIPDTRSFPKGDDEAYRLYLRSSHNLLHEEKWQNYREKVVYRGAMEIAVALSRLPQTQHLKESFVLDFFFVSSQLLVFAVRGLMRDGEDVGLAAGEATYKFFHRTMAVVPKDGGKMAIVNDQLSLTPISSERMERYTKMIKKALEAPTDPQPNAPNPASAMDAISLGPSSALAQMPGPSGLQPKPVVEQQAPPTTPNYDVNDPQIRAQMVAEFSRQSGMNQEWSRKCLEELAWNFEAAGQAFNESRSMIPPEAFQQQ